jgi:hypothetical protein
VRSRTRLGIGLAVASAVAAVAGCSMRGRPQSPTKECLNDQSPRRLQYYSNRPSFFVERAPASQGDAVFYTRRTDGRRWLLKRCGQHYHCQVENIQPTCRQESSTRECGEPTLNSWVEIHTLYAEKMATGNCDPEETPGCCETEAEGDPILVMAFQAKVTSGGSPLHPIPLPWGAATARWSGSTTGTKEPRLCKPPAQWNFLLGCNFTVSQQQIRLFRHIEQARPPQYQLSDDLTYEQPR